MTEWPQNLEIQIIWIFVYLNLLYLFWGRYAINTSSFSSNWHTSSKTTYHRYTEITNSLSSLLFDKSAWNHSLLMRNKHHNEFMCHTMSMTIMYCHVKNYVHVPTFPNLKATLYLIFTIFIPIQSKFYFKKCIIISKLLKQKAYLNFNTIQEFKNKSICLIRELKEVHRYNLVLTFVR